MRVVVVENPRRATEEREAWDLAIMTPEMGHPSVERLWQIRKVLGRDVAETSRGRREFVVNEEVLMEEERGFGRLLVLSTDVSLDAEEMFRLHFQRDVIEKGFETMKGESCRWNRFVTDMRTVWTPIRRWCIWRIRCGVKRSGS